MYIAARASKLIFSPRREWSIIAAEPLDTGRFYIEYAAILAAITPLSDLLLRINASSPLFRFNLSLFSTSAIVTSYIQSLIFVALLALIASKLARRFGGVANLSQSLKLAAYSWTPVWLGGAFVLVPWPLASNLLRLACGLYFFTICYLGIAQLTLVPPERRAGYLATVLVLTSPISVIVVCLTSPRLLVLLFNSIHS